MKHSGYRTIVHIYLIFFVSLLSAIFVSAGLLLLLITIQKPDGKLVRSDWAKSFTENFKKQIIIENHKPHITQSGIERLKENKIGIQILNSDGYEIYSYQKPKNVNTHYSINDLLLFESGHFNHDTITSFVGKITKNENYYVYILHFPMKIKTITMYFNKERFAGGKIIPLAMVSILIIIILSLGILYGFFMSKIITQLTMSIKDVSNRCYVPIGNNGVFSDLYVSLNLLDEQIKESDSLREETEEMRRTWIATITHDLKAPLSPIKGYAELLYCNSENNKAEYKRYAEIMLKNASYMETLIDDLKLTYQLESGMYPINPKEQNLILFLRELVIDILNRPEYENRVIHFESKCQTILFSFDWKLFTRTFQNLILNALIHGNKDTEVTLQIHISNKQIIITISDTGKGMSKEDTKKIFERYYIVSGEKNKAKGTGLGLTIAKNIIELHGGTISVSSILNVGTTFLIHLPQVKVN